MLPSVTGRRFEARAERFLCEQGLRPRSRNYRCRAGEIDLVMQDGRVVVFVEVRYRRSTRFGHAVETVDRSKQERIIRTAAHYLKRNRDAASAPCRFDVVAIEGAGSECIIDWIKNAFSA